MQTVIGVIGEKGSGKESFIRLVQGFLEKNHHSSRHLRFSDFLKEVLVLWDLPASRENLQKLVIVMRDTFGPDTLTHALALRIQKTTERVVFLDGVRWDTDVRMLRSFPSNFLVYLTANVETRYKRTKERKEKAGEGSASYETFLKEERAKTEIAIPTFGAAADFKIVNEGTREELALEAQKFYEEKLKPSLDAH